ncbi:MAG: CDP-alcohol phosphatidyltransferase [Eggerthellales bacterium]|nr:CDP-alcohol phosphatidyltransferase [Eggerthellales bacterium]
MGKKADEALEITLEELPNYLRANHAAYMEIGDSLLYLTDANDIYWRAQDTAVINEKGHYTDCSELVPTVAEFMDLPVWKGGAIKGLFGAAKFYASVKE